jgi:hypothetical protein
MVQHFAAPTLFTYSCDRVWEGPDWESLITGLLEVKAISKWSYVFVT